MQEPFSFEVTTYDNGWETFTDVTKARVIDGFVVVTRSNGEVHSFNVNDVTRTRAWAPDEN